MKRFALLLIALSGCALMISAAPTDPKTKVRAQIETANAAWAKAQVNGDAKAIVSLFAEDGGEFSPRSGHSIRGRDSLMSFWTGAFAESHPTRATVTTVDVALNGDYATEVGNYAYTYPPDSAGKAPQNVSGRYAVVWRRQSDGQWKIFVDMGIPK
jgi:uncharacterized protein (TIGR02246 family)